MNLCLLKIPCFRFPSPFDFRPPLLDKGGHKNISYTSRTSGVILDCPKLKKHRKRTKKQFRPIRYIGGQNPKPKKSVSNSASVTKIPYE